MIAILKNLNESLHDYIINMCVAFCYPFHCQNKQLSLSLSHFTFLTDQPTTVILHKRLLVALSSPWQCISGCLT